MTLLARCGGPAVTCIVILTMCAGCGTRSPRPYVDVLAADIDTTVRPGDDFFRYANGAWLRTHPIPPNERRWGIGNLVQEETYQRLLELNQDAALDRSAARGSNTQKIGDFYTAGMDSARCDSLGLTPLREELLRVDSIRDAGSLVHAVVHFQRSGIAPFFSPYIVQDEKNSAVYACHLYQGGIGLPDRDYYFNTDERTVGIRREYVRHVAAMFRFLGGDSSEASHSAGLVMDLETRLARASRKLEDLRDPYRNYNKLSVEQLDRLTPSLAWRTTLPAMSLGGADSVIVGQPEFFKAVEQILRGSPLEDCKTYLRWTLLNHFAPSLTSAIDRENFRFYGTVLNGVHEQRPRCKRVLDAEEAAMGDILGQLYVARYVPAGMKARYERVVDNMFAAYAERIKRLDWMSGATKQKALAKLQAVTRKVCFPERWKDYSALSIDRSSYCANQLRADRWMYNYYASRLGKPVDRTEWEMTPQTYNAYYNPSNNEIVLPAAIFLIPGLPDSLADDAIVYGYAGASTIGHEVTHGFDDEGRQFDAQGNLRNWWTPEDERRFKEKAQKLVDQFNGYLVVDTTHINGRATLGENIADLGGVVIGYDAFKRTAEGRSDSLISGLTPDQRYFLGYALSWCGETRKEALARQVMTDVHAPEYLRVNGPLSDVEAFDRAFGIAPGSPMWRPDSLKVKIW